MQGSYEISASFIYTMIILEFDLNVFKEILSIQRFSI